MAEEKRRQQRERLRITENASRDAHLGGPDPPSVGSGKKRAPNAEKLHTTDPEAVEHTGDSKSASDSTSPVPAESKYAAKDPFRSRKGDRFS